jgi:alpha-L-rhamnosidase
MPANRFRLILWFAFLVLLSPLTADTGAGVLAPNGLRVEYLADPVGIDVAQPRFSWVLNHTGRGQGQTACQILISTMPAVPTGDQWDSSRVASPESVHVVYAGKTLESGKTYYWKVRYWDKQDRPSAYSDTARFEMGLLKPADWTGRWIAGGNTLRKEFSLAAKPVRARAYIAGAGYYELRVNGHKIGDRVLDPAWTTYDKRVLYATYDITKLLRAGANAIGVMLGEGWYHNRALKMQVDIELEGGAKTSVASDGTWKAAGGPILEDSVYHGEIYDARKEMPGWDRAGFLDAAWKSAALVDGPNGVLSAEMMPPIKVVDTIVPLKMTSPKPGMYVYDMGQNFSGWVRLRVKGPRGTSVKMRHSELIYEDGTLNVENLRKARATDIYTLRGDGQEEVYEPRFTYHGFRYVEITGFPGVPLLDTVRGRVVHSAVKPTGGLAFSKPILNQLQRIIVWGTTSNLHSVPTDCNQRDERMGWMADAHLYGETAMLNFDMAAFYTNFLRNIRDAQKEDGSVPDTVPARGGSYPADPAWGSAYPLFAWYMYEHYGDRRILEQHYDGIKAWTDFLRTRSKDGVVEFVKYGDWVPIVKTDGFLVSTFYYYYSAEIVARAAEILGHTADAAAYRALQTGIREGFHRRYYNAERKYYGDGTQTAQALALFMEMAPKDARGPVGNWLRNDIVYSRDTHLTTGIVGTKYLLPVLTRLNSSDIAYELATQTSYPSWGYMIENGATTLWELWQNKTGPSMNSHNHPMFGSVGAWMYQALAGINADQKAGGYQRIHFAPQMVRDLNWTSGTIETLRGMVASSWSRTPEAVRYEVTIPVGSNAEVVLPKFNFASVEVREGGKLLFKDGQLQPGVAGVASVKEAEKTVTIEAGSGHYVFELTGR